MEEISRNFVPMNKKLVVGRWTQRIRSPEIIVQPKNVASRYLNAIIERIRRRPTSDFNNRNQNDSRKFEPMDWETTNTIVSHIIEMRNSKEVFDVNPKNIFPNSEIHSIYNNTSLKNIENKLIVTIDTNVLISALSLLDILTVDSSEFDEEHMIFIPWVVIMELDNLKRSPELNHRARCAIRFVSTGLQNGKIIGEKCEDLTNNVKCNPDDRILQSCIKLKKKHRVILLTNDKNLRNKAIIHDVESYDHNTILYRLRTDYDMNSTVPYNQCQTYEIWQHKR